MGVVMPLLFKSSFPPMVIKKILSIKSFARPKNVLTFPILVGERAKRARHSQVCSIENRGYILLLLYIMVRANFVLITRKEGGA